MAIPVHQSISASAGSGSTASLATSAPSGVSSGDQLVLFVGVSTIGVTITTPTGWTKVAEIADAPTDRARAALYVRTATGGSDDTPTISFSPACVCEAYIARATGQYASAPVDSSATAYANISTPAVATVTTGTTDCLLYMFLVIDSGTVTGEPSNWTALTGTVTFAIWRVYKRNAAAIGSYGGETITMFGQVVGQEGTANIVAAIASGASGDPDVTEDLYGATVGV